MDCTTTPTSVLGMTGHQTPHTSTHFKRRPGHITGTASLESCVLFENGDKSVVLVDVPRSVELAQVPSGQTPGRRLISSQAIEVPWQNQASKKPQDVDISLSPSAAIDELMTLESVRGAHKEILHSYRGPWCLPRIYSKGTHKRKEPSADSREEETALEISSYIPAGSHNLIGTIADTRETFLKTAPQFELIVLDPPWPSRSARRKRESYATAYGIQEVEDLLSLVPIAAHLKPDGLVAVWITNKPAVIDLLKSPGGMLAQWGLEPIGEWIWLKVTSNGQPIVDMESSWRKPWERLLIAREKGASTRLNVERKVILGVPDLHSRKPNLKQLFDEVLPKNYVGLEIFARNVTAGWWSWGDQTAMFQQKHHWADEDSITDEIEHPS
ncbi:MT-A70 family [Xylariales sp. AK1849]|nr:MT-A70 family [Xylariales sp. AK1849]